MKRHEISRKQPKLSRTIPVYGDPDSLDSGVWYRCWNCKQINNINKNTLGGDDSPSGVVYVDYADNPDYGQVAGIAVLRGITHSYTAQSNGADGNPKGVTNAIMPSDSGSGCALCGSLNYRGDY